MKKILSAITAITTILTPSLSIISCSKNSNLHHNPPMNIIVNDNKLINQNIDTSSDEYILPFPYYGEDESGNKSLWSYRWNIIWNNTFKSAAKNSKIGTLYENQKIGDPVVSFNPSVGSFGYQIRAIDINSKEPYDGNGDGIINSTSWQDPNKSLNFCEGSNYCDNDSYYELFNSIKDKNNKVSEFGPVVPGHPDLASNPVREIGQVVTKFYKWTRTTYDQMQYNLAYWEDSKPIINNLKLNGTDQNFYYAMYTNQIQLTSGGNVFMGVQDYQWGDQNHFIIMEYDMQKDDGTFYIHKLSNPDLRDMYEWYVYKGKIISFCEPTQSFYIIDPATWEVSEYQIPDMQNLAADGRLIETFVIGNDKIYALTYKEYWAEGQIYSLDLNL